MSSVQYVSYMFVSARLPVLSETQIPFVMITKVEVDVKIIISLGCFVRHSEYSNKSVVIGVTKTKW